MPDLKTVTSTLFLIILACLSALAMQVSAEDKNLEGFSLFSQNYLVRASHKTKSTRTENINKLSLFAALGEFEPVTFSIRAHRTMQDITVKFAGDLKSPDANIPKETLDIRVVSPMTQWLKPYEYIKHEYLLKKQVNVTLRKNTTKRFWITIKVPENASPGIYKGNLIISEKTDVIANISYELEVLPIDLSTVDNMKYFTYCTVGQWPKWARSSDYYRKIFKDMRDHGLKGFTYYYHPRKFSDLYSKNLSESLINTLELFKETGFPKADSGFVIWLFPERFAIYGDGPSHEITKQIVSQFSQAGIDLLFYAVDEPEFPDRWDMVRKLVPKMRRNFPATPIVTAIGEKGIREVGNYYDMWICAASHLNEEIIDKAKTEKKKLGVYECALNPSDKLTCRYLYGYFVWRCGAEGAAFWNYFTPTARDRYGRGVVEWQGYKEDYLHYYDFVCFDPNGPIPSVGWECMREGIDDYRYIVTLEKLIDKAEKSGLALVTEPAGKFLLDLYGSIDPTNYGKAYEVANDTPLSQYFNRPSPEPSIKLVDYDKIRGKIANYIIEIQDKLHSQDKLRN